MARGGGDTTPPRRGRGGRARSIPGIPALGMSREWGWRHRRCVPKGWGQRSDSGVTVPGVTNPGSRSFSTRSLIPTGELPATPCATSATGEHCPQGSPHCPPRGDTERGQTRRGGTRATPEGGKGGMLGIFSVLCTKFPAGRGDGDTQGHPGTAPLPVVKIILIMKIDKNGDN